MGKENLRDCFAKNVRSKRKELGLSQEALASEAGLHRTYISDVERSERNVSIDNIERIAVALNVLPEDLLKEEETDVDNR